MDLSLRLFTREFMSVVLASLMPVILVAFLSIPYSLGGHPGEEHSTEHLSSRHMT